MQIRVSIWGAFFILGFFCLQHLARDDYCIRFFFRLLDSIDFATLQQPCSSYSPSSFSSSFSSSASSSSSSSPFSSSSSSPSLSSLSSSSTHSCYILLPSLWSSSVSFIVLVSNLINIKYWRCLWLAATPKNHVRPLPHSDFTLLIPLYDYHPTPAPALLAFVPPPWPQVRYV